MLKNFAFILIIAFSAIICVAQNKRTTIITSKDTPTFAKPTAEFSENEWKLLSIALNKEDWQNAAFRAEQLLSRAAFDNEQKQLAQLRYLYLYALAGKVAELTDAKKDAATAQAELMKAAESLKGKEFVLPPRQFLSDCTNAVNYICPLKENAKALRVTATNKSATWIYSFDYVVFEDKIPLDELADRQIFLGGTLDKIEFNEDLSKPWLMRLTYEKGFANAVEKNK